MFAESGSSLGSPLTASSGHNTFSKRMLRRLINLARAPRQKGAVGHARYRPAAECLESKTLLSDGLGWNGGSGGTQNSLITPANISQLTQRYADVVDGAIVAEPLVAPVNVTVGPSPGFQSVVFVATQHDSLYAFNVATGQLLWHTNFRIPNQTALSPSELDFQGSGIIGTPAIDPGTNTIYLVSSESYAAGDVTHYRKTLHAGRC